MAAGKATVSTFKLTDKRKTISQDLNAVGDTTDWQTFMRDIAVQVTGPATGANLIVERSTRNPTDTANPAPVGDAITGNPSTGVGVTTFYEPGVAFWRVRLVSMTGSKVNVSISGQGE